MIDPVGSGSNDITEIHKQTTCMHLTQESSTSSQYTITVTQSCVAHRLTVSSPPGQPDHTPPRVGVPCVPPHSTYLPRSMNTHSLCTQNALHSPASVQITLAGSLPVTQKSTIPLGSEYRNSTDARRTVRITQHRRRRSKSPVSRVKRPPLNSSHP